MPLSAKSHFQTMEYHSVRLNPPGCAKKKSDFRDGQPEQGGSDMVGL